MSNLWIILESISFDNYFMFSINFNKHEVDGAEWEGEVKIEQGV